jgi:hypothetical protein
MDVIGLIHGIALGISATTQFKLEDYQSFVFNSLSDHALDLTPKIHRYYETGKLAECITAQGEH